MKFRQNNYYSLTLLNHLRERGVEENLLSIFDNKISHYRTINKTKQAEKLEGLVPNICLMASLLQYGGEATNLVDSPSSYLESLSDERLKTALLMLTLLPLIRLHEHYSSRSAKIEIEKLYVLQSNYKLSGLTS